MMSVDMLGIPADAPHPENALRFIDYLLRPEVIAAVTNAVWYPNPTLPATALVKPDIRNDPAVYPPGEIRRRLYVDLPAPPRQGEHEQDDAGRGERRRAPCEAGRKQRGTQHDQPEQPQHGGAGP